ncbi:MAG: DUF1963 domain-containing protein [Lawsonibacter sp.]|nr:DUF1963 domain-containing protein [Lawsonibacter sp.]
MTDTQLAKEIAAQIRAEHTSVGLPFRLEKGEAGLRESKVGGDPYLPRDMEWPLDRQGVPLRLLAQVDCAALSALEDFPHTGLLQFWIGTDDLYGADYDDPIPQRDFRVLYHEGADPTVTQAEVLAKRSALPDGEEERYSPLGDWPCRMVFGQPRTEWIPDENYLFQKRLVQLWNQRRPEKPIRSVWDFYALFPREERDYSIFELSGAEVTGSPRGPWHQLGGFPTFIQNDPRHEEEYQDLDTLLFQLDSEFQNREDLVLWGDCGIGNFFIGREALKHRDFSRVMYNWDCS